MYNIIFLKGIFIANLRYYQIHYFKDFFIDSNRGKQAHPQEIPGKNIMKKTIYYSSLPRKVYDFRTILLMKILNVIKSL